MGSGFGEQGRARQRPGPRSGRLSRPGTRPLQIVLDEVDRFVDLVGLDHQQLARLGQTQGFLDGGHAASISCTSRARAPPASAARRNRPIISPSAAAAIVIFVQNHAIEGLAQQRTLFDQVAVAAIARSRVYDRPLGVRELLDHVGQSFQPRQRCGRSRQSLWCRRFPASRSPRRLLEAGSKRFHRRSDVFKAQTQTPAGCGRGQHVFDLEADAAAVRERHAIE